MRQLKSKIDIRFNNSKKTFQKIASPVFSVSVTDFWRNVNRKSLTLYNKQQEQTPIVDNVEKIVFSLMFSCSFLKLKGCIWL